MIKDEFTGREDEAGKPLSRQRLWQLRRQRDGLCIMCGKPTKPGRQLCDKHTIVQREAMRKVQKSKRRNVSAASYK